MKLISHLAIWKLIWWTSLTYWQSCATDGICRRNLTGRLRLSTYHFTKDARHPIPYMYYRGKIEYQEMIEESTVFVDKSLLIKRILEMKEKVIVITCPASFGKSINLGMLKYFFEVRVQGWRTHILEQQQMSTYKFFTKGIMTGSEQTPDGAFDSGLQLVRWEDYANWEEINNKFYIKQNWNHERRREKIWGTYLNPPMISKYEDIIEQHLGKYCVIYFDFTIDTFWTTSTIYENLKEHIAKLYARHIFVKQVIKNIIASNTTTDEAKQAAQKDLDIFNLFITEHMSFNSSYTSGEWTNSVLWLSRMLHQYIGKPVIILLDDCYASVEHYFLDLTREGSRNRQRKKFFLNVEGHMYIMKRFMKKTFADNPYLAKAIVLGTLPINHDDLFEYVTDCVRYNVVDNDLQEFFGFTETEVALLFEHYKINETFANQAYSFYRGYTPKQHPNLIMYNIKSLMYFLNEKTLLNLWVEFEMTEVKIADRLPCMKIYKKELQPLLDGESMMIEFIEPNLKLKNLLMAAKFNNTITKETVDCAFSIYYHFGFFTNSDNCSSNGTGVCIRIPNEEIRQGIKNPPATIYV